MKKQIILVGGFHEIIELCELNEIDVVGIIDGNLQKEYFSYEVFGNDSVAPVLYPALKNIPVVISPDNPHVRKKLAEFYAQIGFRFINLIHPETTISKYAKIGEGTVIEARTRISANTRIGNFVKINACANITHDVVIGDFTTIAPSAVILGGVKIAEECYIGANSSILPGKHIGPNTIIGAGAVVTKDIHEDMVVAGNPAQKLERR